MEFSEKTLVCSDCGNDFSFTVEEQKFFKEKGLVNEPKRCLDCRKERRRQRRRRGRNRGPVKLYDAVCNTCGLKTQVPFNPDPEKPVYCRECYSTLKNNEPKPAEGGCCNSASDTENNEGCCSSDSDNDNPIHELNDDGKE